MSSVVLDVLDGTEGKINNLRVRFGRKTANLKIFYDTDGYISKIQGKSRSLDLNSLLSLLGSASGTVNAVSLPTTVLSRLRIPITGAGTGVYDEKQEGAGRLLWLVYHLEADNRSLCPMLEIDGKQMLPFMDFSLLEAWLITTTSPHITLGKWDTVNDFYSIFVSIPFPIKNYFRVGYALAGGSAAGLVSYAWEKILAV